MKNLLLIILSVSFISFAKAQTYTIDGIVKSNKGGEAVPFATIQVKGTALGTATDEQGKFIIKNIPADKQTFIVSSVGYKTKEINLDDSVQNNDILFVIEAEQMNLNEVVVTGTRTAKRMTDSPVIVNLINKKGLDQVVAVNLSEGLKYQSGLRVETDCQTCNYTQLRINGLQGGYSQILINSRPIFSPLTGLYGLEQIPVNMIERIEVVRGGVSALYGSGAIGGTVNVITRTPKENAFSVSNTFQLIKSETADNIITANATVVDKEGKVGASFFVNNRNRGMYDANGDNFSELPELKDNSFGTNLFYQPTNNQKLSLSLSSIHEYRYGGEMVEESAHLAQQSEERTHDVLMGSLDYQINFNENKNSFVFYYGGQQTDRSHFTGVFPDDSTAIADYLADPPYGISDVVTHQGGIQFNHKSEEFFSGDAITTLGVEYVYDDVLDKIDSYNYLIDQTTTDLGLLLQHDWNITNDLNLLSGARLDKHNLVDDVIISPRLSALYKLKENTQFRLGWGTGFRAPQAFDTDLHIAFAGGGISRVSLADELVEERSNSFTASVNYDRATANSIMGFTLEGFYTKLDSAFYLFPLGEDEFGERFEKRNGPGATVQGITIEARANFDYVFEVDAGFTVQSSLYEKPVENIEGLPARRTFMRTPGNYGYATFIYTPTKYWSASTNLVYTGSMEIAHFGGEGTGQAEDTYFTSPTFTEVGLRVGHTFKVPQSNLGLELFGGVKNLFDAYQNDFDVSKNRDSNFIYGPALPRTFFIGLELKSL
ncbi:TonB-dependent receptor [Marivirga atlantica]|uniref:TonB-dependent receptor n=1 Tax=Marivirga atlantica TaxID=1548457 RepID=A0A937DIT9_9BACT|nr:TonB-dependent receptor [Marivirga atlantica]MBL0764526.1 TonB-dependent receptor [Marivirga atlantica]